MRRVDGPDGECREVMGFPDHRVSDRGSVYLFADGLWWLLAQRPAGKGYMRVRLSRSNNDGRSERVSALRDVHRLVLEAFAGPPHVGAQARHLNDDKTDNRAVNLAWGTAAENTDDAIRNGLHAGKLTSDDARRARSLYSAGVSSREIADQFGCELCAVRRVIRGVTHRAAGGPIVGRLRGSGTPYDPPMLESIRVRVLAGEKYAPIAKDHGVSLAVVCKVAKGGYGHEPIAPARPRRPRRPSVGLLV